MILTTFLVLFCEIAIAQDPPSALDNATHLAGIEYAYISGSSPPLMTESWLNDFYSKVSLPPLSDKIYDDMKLSDSLVAALAPSSSPSDTPLWLNWPGTVRYAFDPSVGNSTSCVRIVFLEAVRRVQNSTCVTFTEDTSAITSANSLLITSNSNQRCWSTLGYSESQNGINIVTGCMHVGQVTHLLLHALGLGHENLRADADLFQSYNNLNVEDTLADATKTLLLLPWTGTRTAWEAAVLQLPFDFGSITGAGPCYLSSTVSAGRDACNATLSPYPTMSEADAIIASALMGNRDVMTARDASLVNLMYCGVDPKANATEPTSPFIAPPASPGNGYAQNLVKCFLDDVDVSEVLKKEKSQSSDIMAGAGGAFADNTSRTKLIYILVGVGLLVTLTVIAFFFWRSLRRYVEEGRVDEYRSETERPLIVE
jgi:Astacin (Peptidase family M12A)